MFESLSERLGAIVRRTGDRGMLRPEEVDATLREVRMALLEADVGFKTVRALIDRVRERLVGAESAAHLTPGQQVVKAVQEELREQLGGNQGGLRYSSRPPTVIMLVGLQGAGKTTTAVKLALLARRDGHRPMVVGLDLRRPAAVEQLRLLAERGGIPFHSGTGPVAAVAAEAVAKAARINADVVILDTAGRLNVDQELMAELRDLKQAVSIHESLLVADAMTGQEAVRVGTDFNEAVGIDGVILTKLDGDTRGGAALGFMTATGRPIRFAGVGERPEDLEIFHADRMASRILGMGDVLTLIERVERNVDQAEARRLQSGMRSGTLTFEDMLAQMRQLRGMGPLGSLLEMIPGAGRLAGQVDSGEAEQQIRRMEAIIQSMTPLERRRPEIIDGSRRRRIARGSGTQVTDVNRLLKSREAMQAMARQLSGGGKGRRRTVGGGLRGPGGWRGLFGG